MIWRGNYSPEVPNVKGYNKEGWQNTQQLLRGTAEILYQPTVVSGPLSYRVDILTKNKRGDAEFC